MLEIPALKNKRVVILGASGFIGRHVARAIPAGADLYLGVRSPSAAAFLFEAYGIHGNLIYLDLSNESLLRNLFRDLRPAVVFNLIGYGVDPTEREEHLMHSVNAEFPFILCSALSGFTDVSWEGLQLIHTGSALEYGTAGGDLSEDTDCTPTTLYGQTKLDGTRKLLSACKKNGIRGAVARLFTVYGSGEHTGRLLPSLMERAESQGQIQLTGGMQERDFTYVEDVAEGLFRLSLVKDHSGDIVNLVTGKLTTVREFVMIAAGVLKISEERLGFGALPTRKEEMNHDNVSTKRLQKLLEWIPATTIEEGIRKTETFLKTLSDRTL